MNDLVRQSIQDGCGFALMAYMESIGFTHQGGAGLDGESTARFVRGEEHLRVRFRVEEVEPEHRMHTLSVDAD